MALHIFGDYSSDQLSNSAVKELAHKSKRSPMLNINQYMWIAIKNKSEKQFLKDKSAELHSCVSQL